MQHNHSPCEYFATIGKRYILSRWAEAEVEPQPTDEQEDAEPGSVARWENLCVLRHLRGERPKKTSRRADEKPESVICVAGMRIDWHLAMPELRSWGGQSTLESVVRGRQEAIWDADLPAGCDVLDWRVPYPTMSGLDTRTADSSLDAGFSPAKLRIEILTYAAAEIAAVLGLQLTPLIRFRRRQYGYIDGNKKWWYFSIVEREGYHHQRYSISQPVEENSQSVEENNETA